MQPYGDRTAQQLRDLCHARQLPQSGPKVALVARLTRWDAENAEDKPVKLTWEEPPAGTVETGPASPMPKLDTPLVTIPDPNLATEGYEPNTRTYWVMYEVDGQTAVPDDQHRDWLIQTTRHAEAAGYTVRGGLYVGRRVGYVERGGMMFMSYEVSARPR